MKKIELEEKPTEVKVMWSKKYNIPVFLVEGKLYIPDTGEYAGYFTEVENPETKKED